MATTLYIENYVPVVKYGGLNTLQAVDFSGAPSVALPSATTIGGSSVVALGNITSTSTTATAFSVTNTAVFTGTSVQALIANSLTTGTASLTTTNGQTSGHNTVISSTGTIVTTGDLLSVIGNNATTTTGLVRVSATGLTSGYALAITGGTSQTSAGGLINASLGAATAGSGIDIVTTGVYTDTTGLLTVTASAATTGKLAVIIGGAANLTGAGRYLSVNDGALDSFSVGPNGHLHSLQTTAPTIAVGTQAGITAAAITAGSTDTCGTITTTGTSTGGSIINITFNKTYTTAPKAVVITAANAAGGGVNTDPIVTQTATGFTLTIPSSGTYAATPSWTYLVVA